MKAIYLIVIGMLMIGLVGAGILTTTTLTKDVEVSKENLTILTTAKVNAYNLTEKDKGDRISLMITATGRQAIGKIVNKTKETCTIALNKATNKTIKTCIVIPKTSKELTDEKIKFEKDYLNNLIAQQTKLDEKSKALTDIVTITKVTIKEDKTKGFIEEILG